jgi:hypothetical protein
MACPEVLFDIVDPLFLKNGNNSGKAEMGLFAFVFRVTESSGVLRPEPWHDSDLSPEPRVERKSRVERERSSR